MSKLAIIIPYYNFDFFEKTIQSVAAQTNQKFNLYIGNDASPNNPIPIIEKYLNNGDYQYFDYQENVGGKNLALQWKRILKNVQEEWFQILGDDDVIPLDFVENFYHSLNELLDKKINVLKFPIKIINENDTYIRESSFQKKIINRLDFLMSRIDYTALSSLSENIFRTESYLKFKIKEFPLAWHSDDCMIFEYAENNQILYCEDTFVMVRMSGKNISSTDTHSSQKAKATYNFFEYIIQNHYKKFNSLQKKIIIKNFKKHLYYSQYKINIKTLITICFDNFVEGLKLLKYLF